MYDVVFPVCPTCLLQQGFILSLLYKTHNASVISKFVHITLLRIGFHKLRISSFEVVIIDNEFCRMRDDLYDGMAADVDGCCSFDDYCWLFR